MLERLERNWVYGGFLAAFLLLGLLPVVGSGWSLGLMLVFLQLPVYMLHQYEEHDDDRFRASINDMLGKGKNVLPHLAVFIINVPGVWGVNLISFWLAASLGIGWGLIGIYLTLANAVVHILPAIGQRKYNPGLVTAIVLFLPAGLWGAWVVNGTGLVTGTQQGIAIALAVLIHLAIVAYVFSNVRRLARSQAV